VTRKGAWRVQHDVTVVFRLRGFCTTSNTSALAKKTGKREPGSEADTGEAPSETWDRFAMGANESCISGNILKRLNWGQWNTGSNPGALLPGRVWVWTTWPLGAPGEHYEEQGLPLPRQRCRFGRPSGSPQEGVTEATTLRKHHCLLVLCSMTGIFG